MVTSRLPLLVVLLGAPALHAQSEALLKERFEGMVVTPRLAMPGTEFGVDIYPRTSRPLDYTRYADRLKDYGTAIRAGESVMVTKLKVKSKLIEFQLGGGGYGTAGDETSSSVSVAAAPKTKREQNLEGELRRETDPAKKRAMKEELDELRSEREREDARNRAAVAEAEEHKKQNIRQRRLEGGSRFNLRFRDRVPADALTPEAITTALADFVDFGRSDSAAADTLQSPPATGGLPRKGMSVQETDALLGAPRASRSRMEGRLKVVTHTYATSQGEITAEFVEGVLFRYRVTSN
jgi:hypothetical protein